MKQYFFITFYLIFFIYYLISRSSIVYPFYSFRVYICSHSHFSAHFQQIGTTMYLTVSTDTLRCGLIAKFYTDNLPLLTYCDITCNSMQLHACKMLCKHQNNVLSQCSLVWTHNIN